MTEEPKASPGINGWNKWGMHVLAELERLTKEARKHNEHLRRQGLVQAQMLEAMKALEPLKAQQVTLRDDLNSLTSSYGSWRWISGSLQALGTLAGIIFGPRP